MASRWHRRASGEPIEERVNRPGNPGGRSVCVRHPLLPYLENWGFSVGDSYDNALAETINGLNRAGPKNSSPDANFHGVKWHHPPRRQRLRGMLCMPIGSGSTAVPSGARHR